MGQFPLARLPALMTAVNEGREDELRALIRELVPTYRPAGEGGCEDKGEAYARQLQEMAKE